MEEIKKELQKQGLLLELILEILGTYLEKDDIDGLKEYLTAYERKLPPDIRRTFTKNFALNVVCTHYAEEARKYEIDYDVELDMPERLPVNEPEVCALLGNLLENALEAASEMESGFVRVNARQTGESMLLITVDNSSRRRPVVENGRFRSCKREGYGIGTDSVRAIAERFHGDARFSWRDSIFYASVMLNP